MKIILLLFAILFCCAFNIAAQSQIEPEEYGIYKQILEEWFINASTTHIVIDKFTVVNDSDNSKQTSYIKRKLSGVRSETLANYISRNNISFELKNDFNISPAVNFITEEDLVSVRRQEKADLGESFKKAFKEKFSTNLQISFSRVGFNQKRNQALLQVGYNCGTTCGEGNYVLLTKKNDRWIIKKKIISWIS